MAKLTEMTREIQQLMEFGLSDNCLNENEEIDPELVKEYFDSLQMEWEDKIDTIASYIKDLEILSSGIAVQKNVLTARKRLTTRLKVLNLMLNTHCLR